MRRILPIFGCLVVILAVLLLAPAGGEFYTPPKDDTANDSGAADGSGDAAQSLLGLLTPGDRDEGNAREPGDTDEGESVHNSATPDPIDVPDSTVTDPGVESGGGSAGESDAGSDETGRPSGGSGEGNDPQTGSVDAPGGDETGGDPGGKDSDSNGGGDTDGGASGEDAPAGGKEGEEPSECPELMAELLSDAGYDAGDMVGSQLIIVKSSGNSARISAFDKGEDGIWTVFLEESSGHVGRNGVSASKTEGDLKTPMGLFTLPSAFGNEPDPGCLLPYRQATVSSYWVDDPDSASYNMWVEDDGDRDWNSAEHISDLATAYAYAAVVGYNIDPITPGAGSAIFLHVGSGPTAGCISTSRDNILRLLRWLDPGKEPRILIF